MEVNEITREKRLRRAAARQGLRLAKSARRDPYANDYGKYRVENPHLGGVIVAGGLPFDYSLDLDEVEEVLFPDPTEGTATRSTGTRTTRTRSLRTLRTMATGCAAATSDLYWCRLRGWLLAVRSLPCL